jgi:histidinol-phosphate aminotransferase
MIKKNIFNSLKPSINEIAKYIPGESSILGRKSVIKLSSNESPFKIPKKIFVKANKLAEDSNLYPDGDSDLLKDSIAKKFKIKKKRIICGNGSDDILSIITQAFSREDAEIICSEYGFIYYPIIAKVSGAKVVTAKSTDYSISCKNILASISKKTKIIFIANPNNPTGTIIMKNELISFLKKVPENILVVIDGAYAEFVTDLRFSDGLNLTNQFPNLIITRTFSKIFALAGLRLGWAYSSERIIETLEKIRGPFNVNIVAQTIGSLILKEDNFLKKSIRHNLVWKKKLSVFVNSLGLETYKTYANFVLIRIDKAKLKKKTIIKKLIEKDIIIRDLENYDLPEFIRVSIGTSLEMEKFMKTIKSIILK